MNKHLKNWAAAGLMALFMGTAAAVPQVILPKAAITASAADTIKDYKIGKLIYTVNETKGTATVKGLNREYSSNGIIEAVEIPATVTYKSGKSANVTQIGESAFASDRYLRTVTFASGSKVTTIGKEAFSSLFFSSIALPNTVKTIGAGAFSGCSNLTTVNLSTALTAIQDSAFSTCKKLEKITIPATVKSIGSKAFFDNIAMTSVSFESGSVITKIGDKAFQYCEKLPLVTIPATVTSIGDFAFGGCKVLESLSFDTGSKLKTIGERAFENAQFASVTLPATVTSVGAYAFYSCDMLKTLKFASGSKLSSIGNYAFAECPVLSGVTFPSALKTIGEYAFHKCKAIKTVTVPASVTTIGTYAFASMDVLKSVTIGKGVTAIGSNAFCCDKKLTAINVNTANTTYASKDGVLFTKDYKTLILYPSAKTAGSFTAPAETKRIEQRAFSDVSSLTALDFSATSGMEIASNNFNSGCSAITALTIPKAENKSSNGANVLKKYGNLFMNASLTTLNGSPVVNNLNNNTKKPTFHSTIRNAMFDVFENYDKTYFMNRYVDAYAKFAVNDAYSKYGKLIDSRANIENLSQVEKAYAIYKWVRNQAEYDHEEFAYITDENGQTTIRQKNNPKNHCNASVFLHKKSDGKYYTVCDGYARAYSLVMNAAGLECHYVSSGSYTKYGKNISHAFNCVKIGSEYYIADPTSGAAHYFLISAQRYRKEQGTFSETNKWYFEKISDNCKPVPTEKPGTLCKYTFADMDSDTYLGRTDFAPLQMYLVKRISLTAVQKKLADVNTDGSINYLDAELMVKYLKAKGTDVCYRMGDINMDGHFTKADVDKLQKYLLTTGTLNEEQAVLADMNNDGKLNATDLSRLKSLLLYKLGDVNRDGKVNKTDKTLILKHLANIATLSDDALWYADYNGDGSIDVADAVRLAVDYNIPD
ncbi:MAG: leucine-rich repeat protein [Oscillospiraceae bacterium]|nr:leucine-rich repeat protein [Oscillospiraceae bacterium]